MLSNLHKISALLYKQLHCQMIACALKKKKQTLPSTFDLDQTKGKYDITQFPAQNLVTFMKLPPPQCMNHRVKPGLQCHSTMWC